MKCLVIFWSKYGQTEKIAKRIADKLRSGEVEVDFHSAEKAGNSRHLENYDLVVIGSPVYYGRHSLAVSGFISENLETLNRKVTAFFSVGLSTTRNKKQRDDASRNVDAFLVDRGWHPTLMAMFGGGLPYRKFDWITRLIMRWISSREGGSTDTSRDHEYTDWEAVDAFAKELLANASADDAQIAEKIRRDFSVKKFLETPRSESPAPSR